MNAVEPKRWAATEPLMKRPPIGVPVPLAGQRTRRAVWRLLKGRAAGGAERASLDEADRDRMTVCGDAAAVLAFLDERFAGERFDPAVLARLHLVGVLDLVAPGDPEGTRRLLRRLRREIDRFLTLYDWVDNKSRLFEGLTENQASTVTRLYRLRRRLDELLARLERTDAAHLPPRLQ